MDSITLPDYAITVDSVQSSDFDLSNWFKDDECGPYTNPGAARLALLEAQGWAVVSKTKDDEDNITYKFKRRVLDVEKVVKEIVEEYVSAFNKGLEDNNSRYDDIVTCWATTLDKTEDEINENEDDDEAYEIYVNSVIALLGSDYTDYETQVDGIYDSYGESLDDDTEQKFDALSAQALDGLVDSGFYNAVTWAAVSAGIEEARQRQINRDTDAKSDKKFEVQNRLHDMTVRLRTNLMSAKERLASQLNNHRANRVTIRNRVIEMINNFVERRKDAYPNLGDITNIATKLGAGNPGGFTTLE